MQYFTSRAKNSTYQATECAMVDDRKGHTMWLGVNYEEVVIGEIPNGFLNPSNGNVS